VWCPNLQQVFKKNYRNKNFDFWILFLRLDADTSIEKEIREKHERINTILEEQNVNYSEITTFQGKKAVYEKFNFKSSKHPLFYVFNKHPLQYNKKEPFLIVEWGKWLNVDIDSFKNDLMAFVNFFSDNEFREKIANAKNENMWYQVIKFLKNHGFELLSIGITISAAIL